MAVIRQMKVYEELPCGCMIGHFLCPEAERLWAEVNAAYRLVMRGVGTWQQYTEARGAYARHFWEQGVYTETDLATDYTPHFRTFLEERYGLTLALWSEQEFHSRKDVIRAHIWQYSRAPQVVMYNHDFNAWYTGFIPLAQSQEVDHGNSYGSSHER